MSEEILTGELEAYNPFRLQLIELKKQNEQLVFEYDSPAGEKAARSHIAKLRSTKAAIEKLRKDLKDESLQTGRRIDAVAKDLSGEVESMIDIHLKPLQEIEQREKDRVAGIRQKITAMQGLANVAGISAEKARNNIARLEAANLTEESYAEFLTEAIGIHSLALANQRQALENAEQREAEQEELKRLQALVRDKEPVKTVAETEQKGIDGDTAVGRIEENAVRDATPPAAPQDVVRSALMFYAAGKIDGGERAEIALKVMGE